MALTQVAGGMIASSQTLTTPTLASANITTALTLTGAAGTNGQFLTSAGSGSAPTWTTAAASQWTTSGSDIFYNTGNVSIGAAPPAWSGFKVLDVGSVTSLWAIGSGNGTSYYSNNLYYNGSARIYKTTGGASEYTQSGGSHQWYVAASGTAGNSVSLSLAMEINSSRQFGFAGVVGGNFGSQASFFNPGNNGFCAEFNTDANSNVVMFQRTNTYPCTQIQFYGFNGAVATNAGSITHGGNTSTSYNTSSDYRMKENVQPMTSALSKVALLKPVTYKWKQEFGGKDGQGFIAHELQEVIPDCVTGEKDAIETYKDDEGNEQTRIKPQGIDTSFLVATLTAAIQELKALNDTQAATITAQSAALAALTARVVALEGN